MLMSNRGAPMNSRGVIENTVPTGRGRESPRGGGGSHVFHECDMNVDSVASSTALSGKGAPSISSRGDSDGQISSGLVPLLLLARPLERA